MGRIMSALTVFAIAAVVVGCGDSSDDRVDTAGAGQPSSSTTSTTVATATSSEDMPFMPRVNSEAAQDTKVGPIGSTQTISGEGYTIRVQVTEPATIRRVSSSTVTVFVPVSIDVVSGTFDLDPGDWVLRTLSGQEISGATHSSAPTAIGTADVTGHVEGVIPFTDYSSPTRLADDASLSLVQLISTASTPDTITGQWNWPQPVAVETLPTVEK
ncbi:hypothetical protein [uncultured Gordonia sp.]|uniref:hypothetical protein n=1 Tax=uncultured Gordonia sp. TaxID=198437 RepID=UPI00259500E4|nr:hypothetical protein [uncultured Gordonia sp.]